MRDKWPEACDTIDCAAMKPRSRVVKAIPGGGCVWASECEDTNDCTLVRDERACCACFEPFPRSLLADNCCLTDYFVNKPLAPGCVTPCPQVKCKACGPLPGFACSPPVAYGDGVRVCTEVYKQ